MHYFCIMQYFLLIFLIKPINFVVVLQEASKSANLLFYLGLLVIVLRIIINFAN